MADEFLINHTIPVEVLRVRCQKCEQFLRQFASMLYLNKQYCNDPEILALLINKQLPFQMKILTARPSISRRFNEKIRGKLFGPKNRKSSISSNPRKLKFKVLPYSEILIKHAVC